MITRHHLALTGLGTLILGVTFLPEDFSGIFVLVLASCIGTVLPDFHMKKPKSVKARIPAWCIAQFTLWFILPVIHRIYRFLGKNIDPLDKKVTHSLPGIFLVWGVVSIITGVLSICDIFLTGSSGILSLTEIFLAGILLGMLLHLFEDLCTRKGLYPLYPFSTGYIYGSIRPCNTSDPRIRRYLMCNAAVIFLIITARILGINGYPLIISGMLGFLICRGLMLAQSDIEFSDNLPEPGKIPVFT